MATGSSPLPSPQSAWLSSAAPRVGWPTCPGVAPPQPAADEEEEPVARSGRTAARRAHSQPAACDATGLGEITTVSCLCPFDFFAESMPMRSIKKMYPFSCTAFILGNLSAESVFVQIARFQESLLQYPVFFG